MFFNKKKSKNNGVNIIKPNSNRGFQNMMMGNIGNTHTKTEITTQPPPVVFKKAQVEDSEKVNLMYDIRKHQGKLDRAYTHLNNIAKKTDFSKILEKKKFGDFFNLVTKEEIVLVNMKNQLKIINDKKELIENSRHNKYFIINNNLGGGSFKWQKDLQNQIEIRRVYDYNTLSKILENHIDPKNVVIIINSFIKTDFTINNITELYNKHKFKIILPIHDWFWFTVSNRYDNKYHNIYLNENIILPDKSKQFFDICYKLICPSKFVFDVMYKHYTNPKIKQIEWIDYDLSNITLNYQIEKSSTINIGFLVGYSEVKGIEQLNALIKYFKNKNNINIFVVNRNIEKYEDTYESFIKLIKKYKIHGLLYLNKWGETWCYGISKGLACGLPIMYNNIGSFKERVPKDQDKYIINNRNENEFHDSNILVTNFERLLAYIRNNNIMINTIEPKISENNNLINNIIIKENETKKIIVNDDKIIFIITSKIIVSKNKLSYTDNRSLYTTKERFDDTLLTISSIKENLNNPIIVLIDNSELPDEMNNKLHENVSYFIDRKAVNNIKNIDYFTDNSPCKGTAEMLQFTHALKYIKDKIPDTEKYNIFKITGRYRVTPNFDIKPFINDKFIFKKNKLLEPKGISNYYYTCFYKFSGIYIDTFLKLAKKITHVQEGDSYILDNKFAGLEVALPLLIKQNISSDNFIEVDELGIEQRLSVSNNYTSYSTTKII